MRKSVFTGVLGLAAAVLAAGLAEAAAEPGGDQGGVWPSFHGPGRDNLSAETGLMKTWPPEGPDLEWTATEIGHGYSSVAVAGGLIFTAGMIDKETHVIALDLQGKEVWRRPSGGSWEASAEQRWAVPYAGSRGTPTVAGDLVYHLSGLGSLTAFDTRTGDRRWSVDLRATFAAAKPKYGFSESVLVHRGRLFCCPGGTDGYVVALDPSSGHALWANAEIEDPIGYASLVVAEIAGLEQIIGLSAARIFAVKTDSGELLWQHGFGNKRNNNATDAVVRGELVYGSTGYGRGSILLRVSRDTDGGFAAEPVWSSGLLDNHHGGVVLLDGHLYGAGHEDRGWSCLEFETGRRRWQAPGKGSLVWADDRLYCLDEEGKMLLVRPTPEEWDVVGSFTVPSGGRGAYWAHPVVCGGRLYIRHSETLFAYRVAEQLGVD